MPKFNHLAIALTVVLHQAVGYLWYSPVLFQGLWLSALGDRAQSANPSAVIPYAVSVIASILFCYFFLMFKNELQIHTVTRALKLALMLWVSFLMPTLATQLLFLGFSWVLIAINAGLMLINMLLAAYILTTWAWQTK